MSGKPGEIREAEVESDDEEDFKILPAWFVERMMHDTWPHGLLLVTGAVVVINHISRIIRDSHGNTWIDVDLQSCRKDEVGSYPERALGGNLCFSPISRTKASINLAHVAAAFDLGES